MNRFCIRLLWPGHSLVLLAFACASLSTLAPAATAQRAVRPMVRSIPMTELPGSVPDAVRQAAALGPLDPQTPLTIRICFAFSDRQAAEECARQVSDPNSVHYREWLSPAEIGQRFGPAPHDCAAMAQYLAAHGLKITAPPANGLTLAAQGTAAQMQAAFGVMLNRYREAPQADAGQNMDSPPRVFFAPASPVRIPADMAGKIVSVQGLENYTRPMPRLRKQTPIQGPFDAIAPRTAYDLQPIYAAMKGEGRTIAISNYSGFDPAANAPLFILQNNLPVPPGGAGSNIETVCVDVPSGTDGGGEGDLDYQMLLGQAPLARILIYDSGMADIVGMLVREANDNRADILVECYGWQLLPTAAACHIQHTVMTLQGMTYLAASGDYGDLNRNAFQYPDFDPDVLNVGGTILSVQNGTFAYAGETGWHGSGGGTCNYSIDFNVCPAWQTGRNVAQPNRRPVPDIAGNAAGPGAGYNYFWYGNLTANAGTSFTAPIAAASLALVEQALIARSALPPAIIQGVPLWRLGRIADRLYAFNGRDDIFHDVTIGNNGFPAGRWWDYVTGWGSVDWANLAAALAAPLAVSISPAAADIAPGQLLALQASVTGSKMTGVTWRIAGGPGTISAGGVYTAPAAVSAVQTVTLQAVSVLDTAKPGSKNTKFQPDPVFGQAVLTLRPLTKMSGIVHLPGIADPVATAVPCGPFTFTLTPQQGGLPITRTQSLGAGGAFDLISIPGNAYTLTVKGDRWLRAAIPADTSDGSRTVNLSLSGGDANGDNTADLQDFALFALSFGGVSSSHYYDIRADFNSDGKIDLSDFAILVNSFGLSGQQ